MKTWENCKVTYDETVDAWYVYLDTEAGQAHNGSLHHRGIVFDYDGTGPTTLLPSAYPAIRISKRATEPDVLTAPTSAADGPLQ